MDNAAEESEAITRWVEDINESELPIIVEGREDKKALINVGVKNEILVLYSQPFYKKIIESIVAAHETVVILTDFDKEGKRLFGMLYDELGRRGVRIDKKFRETLQKTKLDQIEGIEGYVRRRAGPSI